MYVNKVKKPTMKNRHDIVLVIEAIHSNPNGDPDAGNAPRIIPIDGRGLITSACIKHKLRQAIQLRQAGNPDFCNMHIDTTPILGEAQNLQLDKEAGDKDFIKYQLDRYYDMRLTGTVMCGYDKKMSGPLQVGHGFSVSPVELETITVTRQAISKDSDVLEEGKETMMGEKTVVAYGLYVVVAQLLPNPAKRTGFTDEDRLVMMDGFVHMFDHDRASARSKVNMLHVFDFCHEKELGDGLGANLTKVSQAVKITPRQEILDGTDVPRSREDYTIEVDMDGLPSTIELTDWINP